MRAAGSHCGRWMRRLAVAMLLCRGMAALGENAQPTMPNDERSRTRTVGTATFQTSDRCLACHNGLVSERGEDVSIGIDWRTSLMANSARDPYWQASVRRETQEHAVASEFIQDDCSVCHMPMARYLAKQSGHPAKVFEHLPMRAGVDREASDGVSCSVCQ